MEAQPLEAWPFSSSKDEFLAEIERRSSENQVFRPVSSQDSSSSSELEDLPDSSLKETPELEHPSPEAAPESPPARERVVDLERGAVTEKWGFQWDKEALFDASFRRFGPIFMVSDVFWRSFQR